MRLGKYTENVCSLRTEHETVFKQATMCITNEVKLSEIYLFAKLYWWMECLYLQLDTNFRQDDIKIC